MCTETAKGVGRLCKEKGVSYMSVLLLLLLLHGAESFLRS